MPIGSPITLDLPTANDSFAVWSAKMKTAIQTIEAILEAKVTAGSLDITTALSVGGSYITNLSYIKLTEQDITTPTGEGTLYLDADGELVIITADGSVKLTEGGAINVAAINGIGGDYGGANPAIVYYDTLSGEYRFYENGSGTYATLAANDVVLRNNPAPGSVRLGPVAAVTTDLEMYVHTLPASGVGGLAYNASNKAIVNATVTRETATHLFTNVDLTEDASARRYKRTQVKVRSYSASEFADTTTGVKLPSTPSGATPPVYRPLIANGQTAALIIGPCDEGERISRIIITGTSLGAGSTFSQTVTRQAGNTAVAVAGTSSGSIITTGNYDITFTTPVTLTDGELLVLVLASTGANGAYLHEARVYYDLPAG